MFFSTELLSKRDSGYGLLWLAATLGSKSKKLPRRSVLTADIIQLCNLISEPPEPLALRLSSNLMVGVVRVYKLKHEIFETDVTNCVASLKKTLQELHVINNVSLEMAQPNGLREDALNLVEDPGMAMENEFDGIIDNWDYIFRSIGSTVEGDDEFNPEPSAIPGEPSSALGHQPNKNKLHLLDESHDHLFSTSFINSLSGEGVDNPHGPSSSANDVLFDLDFGADPDVGLGEEMERDLEEAWNIKVNRSGEVALVPLKIFNFDDAMPMDVENAIGGEDPGGLMDFGDDPFGPSIGQEDAIDHENGVNGGRENHTFDWLPPSPDAGPLHTPPPRGQHPSRSILTRQTVDGQGKGQSLIEGNNVKTSGTAGGVKKSRKKVTLVDPRTELTDEELKFQRDNYPQEMARLRREAQNKKEQKDGKRRFEEELWAPPKDFIAPELIELWNQRVVYPVKVREAVWRKKLEELQHPKKKRRLLEKSPSEQGSKKYTQDIPVTDEPIVRDFDFGMDVDVGNMGAFGDDWGGMDAFNVQPPAQGDLPSGSHRSSDEPGLARRGSSRPPSLPGSSLLGRGAFLSHGDPVSNSIFPWDNAGPSSSNAALPASVGAAGVSGSGLGMSLDSNTVHLRRGSRTGSRDSPIVYAGSLQGEERDIGMDNGEAMEFDVCIDDQNPGETQETQESESVVTLERNSFNFLEYAKMHMASDSKPLLFSDILPTESSSNRIAAEGFYHCLALATKDLIRLEQTEPYGPIKIQMK